MRATAVSALHARRHALRSCLATAVLVILGMQVAAATTWVRYYYTPADAVRYAYYYDLLDVALKKTEAAYGPYRVERETTPMSSMRWNEEAIAGQHINVMWSNIGHTDLNEKMIPIPVPADRGVHGYRVFIIRAERQKDFDKVHTLADLRRFVVGQGENWGDIAIFRHNALSVVTALSYESLFPMLNAGRFDYFSRSILEAPAELKAFGPKYPDLVVEDKLLLHYKFPVLFFVSKSSPGLAKRLKAGLQTMAKDGSLNELFNKYFEASLEKLNLKSRRVIELENPNLPDFLSPPSPAYWFDPLQPTR